MTGVPWRKGERESGRDRVGPLVGGVGGEREGEEKNLTWEKRITIAKTNYYGLKEDIKIHE
jgi:hypothetical protein